MSDHEPHEHEGEDGSVEQVHIERKSVDKGPGELAEPIHHGLGISLPDSESLGEREAIIDSEEMRKREIVEGIVANGDTVPVQGTPSSLQLIGVDQPSENPTIEVGLHQAIVADMIDRRRRDTPPSRACPPRTSSSRRTSSTRFTNRPS